MRREDGFVRHLLHAAPVIAAVSALVFVLGHWGFLRTFETAALDTWLRLKAPQPVANVVIVAITDCDYRELFGETSPLNPGRVADLLQAIVAGRPKVVGVDLDTNHPSFAALSVPATGVPVIWAREAVAAEDDMDDCAGAEPASANTGTAMHSRAIPQPMSSPGPRARPGRRRALSPARSSSWAAATGPHGMSTSRPSGPGPGWSSLPRRWSRISRAGGFGPPTKP